MKLQITILAVASLFTASAYAHNCSSKCDKTKAASACATKCETAKEKCDVAKKDCETKCDKAAVTHYTVTGMTCGGCTKKLNTALATVKGVEVKKICHKSGCVDVVLSDGATAKQVEDVITKTGYKIVPAKKS